MLTIMQILRAGYYSFEQVGYFKYLRVNINQINGMHNEIKLRLDSENRGYHTMRNILSSWMLSKETKTKLFIGYLRPIVMYACEIWETTKSDKQKLK